MNKLTNSATWPNNDEIIYIDGSKPHSYHDDTPEPDEVMSQVVALSERMTVLEELVNRLYEMTVYLPGHD